MAACLALTSCATAGGVRIRSVKIAGTTHLLLSDVAAYYGLTCAVTDTHFTLSGRGVSLRFSPDSRDAVVKGVKVSLSEAATTWNDKPVISEVDFRRLLDPILRSKALPRRTVTTIVLDPGHGGKDQGAAGGKSVEKDLTLAVAGRLAAALRQSGYTVHLTRTTDAYLSLDERVALARKHKPDLFISLHANAADADEVRGIETFLLTPEGTTSTYSDDTKDGASVGNAFDKENARLAYELQRGLVRSTRQADRGIKHAEFRVLRDAPCPAALVEMGFISNAADEKKMRSASHQKRIAQGLWRGIRALDRAVQPP